MKGCCMEIAKIYSYFFITIVAGQSKGKANSEPTVLRFICMTIVVMGYLISSTLNIRMTSHKRPLRNKIGHRDCSLWAHGELSVSLPWAHRELAVTKTVTASWDWAVIWAVIELWPSRDWAVIILTSPWLSCDLAVTELWPSRDWAVTSPWLSCYLA